MPASCSPVTAPSPAWWMPRWRLRSCSECSGVRRCWPGSSRMERTTWPGPRASPHGSLVLSNATLGPDGKDYTAGLGIQQVPAACRGKAAGQLNSCLASQGFHTQILYQPASSFWTFQGIEAGLFIVLAATLVAVAYGMVLARDA